MFSSVIYILVFLMLFSVLFLLKKDNCSHHSAASWLVICAAIFMWINCFIAGIFGLFNIPVTLISLTVIYIIFSVLGFYYIVKHGRQKYSWKISDFVWLLGIVIIAVIVGFYIHTPRLLIADVSGDTCMHYRYAFKVAETGIVKGEMFYAPVNNGIFIALLKPFLFDYQYYKAFVAMGIMMLALSGCVLYAVTSDFMNNRRKNIICFCAGVLYMLGYPLHNELMGFVYLGMSITIVVVLIYLFHLFRKNILDKKWAVVFMMFGCFALVMCYMLFAPFVYIALFISLAVYSFPRYGFKVFVKWALGIFLIPSILAIYYCYFNFFHNRGLAISNAISTNGGTRGRLYSYILVLVPAAIYMVVSDLKKRRFIEVTILLVIVLSCMIGALFLVQIDKFSFYYYTKILYLLWYILFLAGFYGLHNMYHHEKNAFISYMTVITILGVIFISNINQTINTKASETGYGHLAENYRTISFGIYNENNELLHSVGEYDSAKIKLYRYIKDNLSANVVPVLGDIPNYLDVYWCENFTGQDLSDYYYWTNESGDTYNKIVEGKTVQYVLVLYGTSIYQDNKEVWDQFEKVYNTKAGCILKLN